MKEPPNLLIVDDSTAIRKILIRVLNQTNLALGEVLEAGDGKEALNILEGRHISLVLSDINMPNMDGIELLRTLRASPQWHDLPVVLITTEGGQARVQEAVELGATSYVRKPFSADQLRDKLAALLSK
ncbi:MAG TPA: response regulator [Bryobacteraceae bacterium]|nr:response regulator [Bryobacteraceae bacterium]